ncbi:MAG: exodeoxyribonuclease VII large subunit [Anaerolineae bacterium]|nr:exodeoxyribonuclease VII large subunit [Anaerolineae bacterium]
MAISVGSDHIYSVSQLTAYIKSVFQMDPFLQDLWVEGEVSNFSRAASGHCYFTLKDERAALNCVMWRSQAEWLPSLPRDGEAVLAHGAISVYEARGIYQLYVDILQPAGLGRLYLEFEALKQKLAREGLFDQARKRPLPRFPQRIGLVTSPQAAALQDILRTLSARYPLADVLLAPTLVQGDEAPPQIVAAIAALNRWSAEREPVDVIILARGGGSLEELWAFNDERVARAIAASAIPIVTGVGHETDFTIADFVADLRAPTPTGAAAAVVPDVRELAVQVHGLAARLAEQVMGYIVIRREALARQERALARNSPLQIMAHYRQRVDELSRAAAVAWMHQWTLRRERLAGLRGRLEAVSPLEVLARGYAIVRHGETGKVVCRVAQVASGDPIAVRVQDGEFGAEVK